MGEYLSQLFRNTKEFLSWRSQLPSNCSVGLVPTMGNLHAGHASLIEESVGHNDFTIVTIFVNPKQFGPNEDFDNYPRTLEADLEIISQISKDKVIVFAPGTPSEIYPQGFSTCITVKGPMTEVLCGAKRPGHFEGVTTVVYQLFMLTRAARAYFGLKDYQQLQIIKRMSKDLHLPVQIISMPIKRDETGLALSSRNQYLTDSERKEALSLSQALKNLRDEWQNNNGEASLALRNKILNDDPTWDYLDILDGENLTPPTGESKTILFAGARFFGRARLIDNLTLEQNIVR